MLILYTTEDGKSRIQLRAKNQNRAKPNAQAALLIRLAACYPDFMDRLASA